jgi:hypothetical protein
VTPRQDRWKSIILNVFVGLMLLYVFLWNLRSLVFQYKNDKVANVLLPKALNRVAQVTHVDQGWSMFAPKVFTDNGWYVFPGRLKSGKDVDLFLGDSTIGKPILWSKPEGLISHLFPNERWRRYQMNLWARAYSDQRANYCRYLTREWNRTHTEENQLVSFALYYVLEETLPDYVRRTRAPFC